MRKVQVYCFKCGDVTTQVVLMEHKVRGLFEDHTNLTCQCEQCECLNNELEVSNGKDDVLL